MKSSIELTIITTKNLPTKEFQKEFHFKSKYYDNLIYCFEEILTVLNIPIKVDPTIYINDFEELTKCEELCKEITNFLKEKYSLNFCFTNYFFNFELE